MPKEKSITFKVETKTKEIFFQLCKDKHTTPSHELNLFVHQKIKQLQGTQISLKELRTRK